MNLHRFFPILTIIFWQRKIERLTNKGEVKYSRASLMIPLISNDPLFIERLSPTDQISYNELRVYLESEPHKKPKMSLANSFFLVLCDVFRYVTQSRRDIHERAIVCGLYRMPNAFAINIKQFTKLYHKSRSLINLMLLELNFKALPPRSEAALAFFKEFPEIKKCPIFSRQWTMRSAPYPKSVLFQFNANSRPILVYVPPRRCLQRPPLKPVKAVVKPAPITPPVECVKEDQVTPLSFDDDFLVDPEFMFDW